MGHEGMVLSATYDLRLVVLSFVVAVLASYTALDLTSRLRVAAGRLRLLWLAGGAVAMGLGIWSMHFVGMLAFSLPLPVHYNVPIVLLSLVIAVLAAGLALLLMSHPTLGLRQWLAGGTVMGLAIAAMHYTGMAGMQLPAALHYDPLLVALSLLIAIGASFAALGIAFRLRGARSTTGAWWKLGSALVMGSAICGMHYTAMAAAHFTPSDGAGLPRAYAVAPSALGATAIGTGALIVLGFTLLTALLDRRFAAKAAEAERLRHNEERLRWLGEQLHREQALLKAQSEASLDGILVVSPEGQILSFNQRFCELWHIPEHVLATQSDAATLRAVEQQVADPQAFLDRVAELYHHSDEVSQEEIHLKDGRTFDRYSAPVTSPDGVSYGRVWFFRDITEHKRAEAQQRFLTDASTLLAASLDYETTLQNVTRLVVPQFANWCTVDVREADGVIKRLIVAHVDPAKEALARTLQERYPLDPDAPSGVAQVLRTGQPVLYPDIPDSLLVAVARDAEHLQILREVGFTSAMLVPLVVRGQILGVITFVATESGRRYGSADLALAEELARRAAVAIDNARLYRAAQEELTARTQAETAVRVSEARLAAIINSAMDAIITINAAHQIEVFNAAAEQIFRCPASAALGQPIDRFIPERFRALHTAHIEGFGRTGTTSRSMRSPGTLVGLRANGEEFPIEATIAQEEVAGQKLYTVILRDVTERMQAEQALRAREEHFRTLVQNAADMITVLDVDGTIRYQSPASARVLGYPPADLVGTNAFALVHPDDLAAVQQEFQQKLHAPETTFHIEYRCRHRDGSWRVLESTGTNLLHNSAVNGVVVNSRDITEQKAAQEQLRQQALYDALTGLPNRSLFLDRLEHALLHAKRYPQSSFAVLFLDLDRFKTINDSLGHLVGDQLLRDVAQRLTACLRAADTAARLGGDEFALLLEEVTDVSAAIHVAQRIQRSLAAPVQLPDQQVVTSASIGITLYTDSYQHVEELLRDADIALYRAKAQGRARHVVFDPAMHARAMQLLQLEADLRRALERAEFQLYYQPIVDLAAGHIHEVEALVRWQHPKRGLISPAQFIPVAEDTGLIVPLGAWVLRTACQQAQAWQAAGLPPLTVAVNLSARQFRSNQLHALIAETLAETGLAPQYLKLELTESSVMDDAEAAIALLSELKALGIQVAIDDFGTGYSSLSSLKRLPLTTLKVDYSFVRGITSDPNDAAIARAIIALGRSLDLQVIAEGVETAEQLAFLEAQQCHAFQGYLCSRPLPADTLMTLLQEGRWFTPTAA